MVSSKSARLPIKSYAKFPAIWYRNIPTHIHSYVHTTWRIKDAAVPTIATVATGARALMANARAEAVDPNNANTSIKKKNLPASGS